MISREKKLRWRRLLRRQKRQVEDITEATEVSFDKHFFRRLIKFPQVQRFIAGWVGLFLLLILAVILQIRALANHYQAVQPKAGGTYTEGIIGTFTNANPLYASNAADSSVSRLVFSSLLKYDKDNKLAADLAESWLVDASEHKYTLKLRDGVSWHDGHKLSSRDVVFTYRLIQNSETKSYLLPSWQGVKVSAPDDRTVVFTLPNKLSSFPHSLTTGIVPEHVLAKIPPGQLRSHNFNNATPIGSGPFKFEAVEVSGTAPEQREERVGLKAFDKYFLGRPKLDKFVIRTFNSEKQLVAGYSQKQINAMVGLASKPDNFASDKNTAEYSLPQTGEVMVFFKTNQEALKDPAVRKALILSVDKRKLLDDIPYPLLAADGPLLRSHPGYSGGLRQATNKPKVASKLLDDAGWKKDPKTGLRAKDGVKLSFRLLSETNSEYASVAGGLQKRWHELGADIKVELQSDQELQTNIALHNYDALLYGISIGPDPDVFAYWHSTQADPRSDTKLNFSEYKSKPADQALEAGRTRTGSNLRAIKYKPFLEAWLADAPALALYQPRFLYVVREPFHGFDNPALVAAPDRFTNVHNWTIREGLAKDD